MNNRFNVNESEKDRIRALHGINTITEQVKEGGSDYTIPYNEDYIQEWVDRWNAFIYDRLDGGYGGPNDIQSEIDYELRTLCPEVMEVLQASYDVWGWNVARGKSWVDNNIQTQIVPKIEQWKNNGGDMTTLERPEINLKDDCPEFYEKRELKESDYLYEIDSQPKTVGYGGVGCKHDWDANYCPNCTIHAQDMCASNPSDGKETSGGEMKLNDRGRGEFNEEDDGSPNLFMLSNYYMMDAMDDEGVEDGTVGNVRPTDTGLIDYADGGKHVTLGGNCDHCDTACATWPDYQQCFDNCCGGRGGMKNNTR